MTTKTAEVPLFKELKNAIAKQFEVLKAAGKLYKTTAAKDKLWETYLAAWPAGTNPVYRERTEHDCQRCKAFIRTLGSVVALVDGKVVSLWDVEVGNAVHQTVVDALAALVHAASIDNIFLHTEKAVGVEKSFEELVESVKTWEHFHVRLPDAVVPPSAAIGPKQSEARSRYDVLLRGLKELTLDAIDTVLELIAQSSLYRGEEHKFAVEEFKKLKVAFAALDNPPAGHGVADVQRSLTYERKLSELQAAFVWGRIGVVPPSVSRIRNTSIGTLLVDLSEGLELDAAVAKFEKLMAPANYKRPTALVTKAMIEKARQTIEELGLSSALERRYAVLEDITVNNMLFADRSAKKSLRGSVFDELAAAVPEKLKALDKAEEVTIDKFLAEVLPTAKTVEVLLENRHAGNLVSLIAPVDPGAKNLFKWPNKFSWSYAGEVADSIKERVKKAGGSVTGDLCCRLAWDYTDDLDLHMLEPGNSHIYYAAFLRRNSPNGGQLDLDANGVDGMKEHPAENIFYADKHRMADGVYELRVNNFNRRSSGTKGFEMEVEFDGQTHNFVYEKVLAQSSTVTVAEITLQKGVFTIETLLPSSTRSKTLWGLPTQTFHRVSTLMLSPNHWDNFKQGNKHIFFMLTGCTNDAQPRGFYNEFLAAELEPHRRTMEMVGAKMKPELVERQLSGLGFSSTQRAALTVRVTGTFARVLKVIF